MSVSDSKQSRARKKSSASERPVRRQSDEHNRSTPQRQLTEQTDRGQPGGGKGRVDITGKAPEDMHVDPNIMEGHPGYEESGPSEIHAVKTAKSKQPDVKQGRRR